jgi:hypothetical protein
VLCGAVFSGLECARNIGEEKEERTDMESRLKMCDRA